MCDEILVLQDGTLKTIASADDEALAAEFSATPEETAPIENKDAATSNREKALWKLLMQKSNDYEVLDDEEKEGEN